MGEPQGLYKTKTVGAEPDPNLIKKRKATKKDHQNEKRYLDPRNENYQKQIKDFKNRNFMLPQYQDLSENDNESVSDKVIMLLKHVC